MQRAMRFEWRRASVQTRSSARPPAQASGAIRGVLFAIVVAALNSSYTTAADSIERLRPDGIVGTVLLTNIDPLPGTVVERFVQAAGDEAARLVIVVGREKPLTDNAEEKLLAPWDDLMPASIDLLYIATREQADDAENSDKLHHATGVWLSNIDAPRFAAAGH